MKSLLKIFRGRKLDRELKFFMRHKYNRVWLAVQDVKGSVYSSELTVMVKPEEKSLTAPLPARKMRKASRTGAAARHHTIN